MNYKKLLYFEDYRGNKFDFNSDTNIYTHVANDYEFEYSVISNDGYHINVKPIYSNHYGLFENQLTYKQLIDLGFKEKGSKDEVYENMYGHKYYWLEYKLSKRKFLEWGPATLNVSFIKIDKNDSIIRKIPIRNIEMLRGYLK